MHQIRVFSSFWTVEAVKGSDQVSRVYLPLSNLDFRVWLQNGRGDNSCGWRTNEIRCVLTIWPVQHSYFDVSLFHSYPALTVWFCQLTRWVHDAQSRSSAMQNIQFIKCEVCYLNGESGLQSGMSVSSQTFSSFFCGYEQSNDETLF